VIDIVTELRSYGVNCLPVDPHADPDEVRHEYGVELSDSAEAGAPYAAVILAVKHRCLIADYPLEVLRRLGGDQAPVLIDVKGFFSPEQLVGWGSGRYWRL
jgi:UDP-N-acetyl-D-galactosamine dehydrogenase